MSSSRHIQGSCACERYTYIIDIPAQANSSSAAQVLFDRVRLSHPQYHRQHRLTPYVRIPLSWYHSSTHAFFPDETHNSIRRMYQHQSPFQRYHHTASVGTHIFCGFCGTNLTFWSENPPEEKDWIYAHLDTLRPGEGLRDLLDTLDTSPDESDEEVSADADAEKRENAQLHEQSEKQAPTIVIGQNTEEVDWFTTMLQRGHLGNSRMVRHSGVRREPGGARIEWDIVEISPDDTNLQITGKRKLGDVENPGVNQNMGEPQ